MRTIYLLIIGLLFISFASLAQTEQCNDGVDNDGDGLIDCNDPDCQFPPAIEQGCNCEDGIDNDGDGKTDSFDPQCASYYGLTFVGDDSDCSVPPPTSADFFDVLDAPAVSGQNTVDTQSKMAIGDIDGDGIPDVVATSKWGQQIRLIATTDGQADGSDAGDIKSSYKTTDPSPGDILKVGGSSFYFDLELLIADIDGDGTGEMFATIYQRKNSTKAIEFFFLARYDYIGGKDLALTWAVNLGSSRPGIPGIADFDGDGTAEIYLKNRIYAAESGILLADAGGNWVTEVNSAPVAVNIITSSPNLELVSGRYIYSVPSLAARSFVSLTQVADMNALGLDQYFPKEINDVFEYGPTNFSSTSVADFDNDGNLDIFLSGALGSTSGPTAVFYWNVSKNTVGTFLPTHPDTGTGKGKVSYPNGWPWGTGRVNLGELDGDGILEANFISGNQLYALEEGAAGSLQQLWSGPRTLNDFRSGVVATTVYDFNNDGNPELVYRDTQVLSIIDGPTGLTTHWSTSCQSHTMTEGPIIADVNGDGATDICVPCFRGPGKFKLDGDLSQQALGEIRLFFSSENAWLPTRKVYNQPGYFVVNINDNLTLPFPQLDQVLQFGSGACSNGIPGPQQPFNTFLNQVPTLGSDGCPIYPGPDIAFVGDDPNLNPGDPGYVDPSDPNYFPAIEVIPPICGDLAITVNFNIINDGLRAITDDIVTSFWDGDPSLDPQPAPPAQLLHIETLPLANFGIGDTLSYSGITFNSTGKAFDLFVVLNDDGTSVPIEINGGIDECKIGNNIYQFPIVPEPFEVEIEILQDNIKCVDAAPDNGEIRGVVYEGGIETSDYSKYSFQWYLGTDTSNPIAAPQGLLRHQTGLAEGDYTVVATNIAKGCSSTPTDTTIVRIGQQPVITIVENSAQTQCSPFNGELEVFVTGGNLGYTFAWFDNLLNPLGVTSPVVSNLQAGEYIVAATKDGCTTTESYTLGGPVFPDAQAITMANVQDCTNPTSGSVDAEAFISGVQQPSADYTFKWYFWDDATNTLGSLLPPVHGTGKTRTGLPVGWYAVEVTNNATNCPSFPPIPTEVQDLQVFPDLVLTELAPQTSCDPLNPNGQLQVDISVGGVPESPLNYTIQWFIGDNTLPANEITTTSGVNGEIGEGIGGGGVPHTVKVTSAFGCVVTANMPITENLIVPVISANPISNTICDPALATATTYDGQIISAVTFDGNPISDFTDYTFTWYDGSDVTSDPVIAGETTNTLPDRNGGFYSVTVTKVSLGCTSLPVTVEILNVEDLPDIVITETPETTCPGAATPNGILSGSVDVGGSTVVAGFTYNWYSGTDTSIPGNLLGNRTGSSDEAAIELDGDNFYTLEVINNATGCVNELSYNLQDNSVLPIGSAVMTPNNVCDPALTSPAALFSGSVTATLLLSGVPVADHSTYTFTWHQGNSIAAPVIPGQTTRTISALEDGYYTFTAIDPVLSCNSLPFTIEVTSSEVLPAVTLTEDFEQTSCDPANPNGQLTASALTGGAPSAAGYAYEWFVGAGMGTPFVVGTHGTLSGADNETASNLAATTFTVRVTDKGSGCQTNTSYLVTDNQVLPVIAVAPGDITPNSVCNPALTNPAIQFNGQIIASATYDGAPITLADYRFDWYDRNTATAPIDFTAQGDAGGTTYSNIEDGFYTLTITRTTPGPGFMCTSDPITVEVLSIEDLPVPTLTEDFEQTSCDPANPNGQLTASALTAGIPSAAGYTYEWFIGPGTGTPFVVGTHGQLSGADNETASELAATTFTVRITDNGSGCLATVSYLVTDNQVLPVIAVAPGDITPNSVCNPALTNPAIQFNGQIIASATYDGAPITLADYRFDWYDRNTATAPIDFTAQGDAGGTTYSNIEDGFYTLTITRTTPGPGFMCTSDPITVEVLSIEDLPVPTLTEDFEQTSCDPANPNGQLTASALTAGIPSAAGYTYEWFIGPGTGTPFVVGTHGQLSGADNETASELAATTFTVRITDNGSGCLATVSYLVTDNQVLPVIAVAPGDITPNSVCNPALTNPAIQFNGQIIASATYDGAPITLADYRFDWYDRNTATAPIDFTAQGDAGGTTYSNIEDGFYTLTITRTTPGPGFMCTSDPITVEVLSIEDLPVPTLTEDFEQTSCDPANPNGQLTASALTAGIPSAAGYTYEWFVGPGTGTPFVVGTHGQLSGADNETASELVATTFTVRITDKGSGCLATVSYLVTDNQVLPVIAVAPGDITPNSVCNPALTNPAIQFNGQIIASATYDGAPITLADYRFDWYDRNTATAPIDFTAQGDAGGTTYSNIEDGFYTLTITRTTPGPGFMCTSDPITVEVLSIEDLPVPTLTEDFEQTSCDPANPNGQLTASALTAGIPSAAGYTYEWFIGPGTGTPFVVGTHGQLSGADNETASELAATTFTVRITDNGSGCLATVSYLVTDNQVLPVIAVAPGDITPNSVCNPALTNPAIQFNGQIIASATYDGAPITLADYRFDWYDRNTATAPIDFTAQGDAGGTTYSNIEDGFYTLTITRTTPGPGFMCTSDPITVEVLSIEDLPVPTLTEDLEQTSCDPANPNGQLTASALTAGIPSAAGYTYEWFVGNDTNTPFVDPADGSISGADGETIGSLSSQMYTVLVTDLGTGCQSTQAMLVNQNVSTPVVTLNSMVPNTVCDDAIPGAYDGSLTVNVFDPGAIGVFANYEFDWYSGPIGSLTFIQTIAANPTITAQKDGLYTVIVRNTVTTCESTPVTFTIDENLTDPSITLTPTDQTSCNPALLNGEINATVVTGGVPSVAGYTYDWYKGTDTSTPFVNGPDGNIGGIPVGVQISAIATGFYTLVSTDLATGCTEQETLFLGEIIQVPVVSAVASDHTDCTFDGFIVPSVAAGPPAPAGYNFDWYRGSDTSGGIVATTASASPNLDNAAYQVLNPGQNLPSDFFTVVATDIDANCVSAPATVFLDRPPTQFTIESSNEWLPSFCNDAIGIITAWVDLNSNGVLDAPAEVDYTRFTFEWYFGNPTDPNASFFTDPTPVFDPAGEHDTDSLGLFNPGPLPLGYAGTLGTDYFAPDNATSGATIFGLIEGRWTVAVTDNTTGCKEFLGVDLPFAGQQSVTLVSATNSNLCPFNIGDGTLEVEIDNATLGPFAQTDFVHNLYEGNNADRGNEYASIDASVAIPPYIFSGLPPGTYTIESERTDGCFTLPVTQFLDSAARQPAVTPTIVHNTACGSGNGTISMVVAPGPNDTSPASGVSYTYAWTSANPILPAANVAAINTLLPGDYTVVITDDNTGCDITRTYTILDQPVIPDIIAVTSSPNVGCGVGFYDGSLNIVDGAVTSGDVTDYTYKVFYEGTAPGDEIVVVPVFAAGSVTFPDLQPGTYYVEATRTTPGVGNGCDSAPVEAAEIIDNATAPAVTLTVTSPNNACDLSNPDGVLRAVAVPAGTYTFTWFKGQSTDPLDQFSDPADGSIVTINPTTEEIQDVLHDDYTVVAFNTVTGCSVTATANVSFDPESPEITLVTPTNQTICTPPNGSITVNQIRIGAAIEAIGDYSFEWFEGLANLNANNPLAGEVLPTLAGYPAATYYVVATKIVGAATGAGCSTPAVPVIISDAITNPTLALASSDNTACDNNWDGAISATGSTLAGPGAGANYNWNWQVLVGEPAPPADVLNDPGPVNFPGIEPGTYSLQITNLITQCTDIKTISVIDNPQPIVFTVADITSSPMQYCSDPASLVPVPVPGAYARIDVNSVGPGLLTDYTFNWFFNDPTSAPLVDGGAVTITDPFLDYSNYPTIAAGTYYVVAMRNPGFVPGSGCTSAPVEVIIEEQIVNPVLTLSATDNTACDNNFDAIITASAVTTAGPGAGANYNWNWQVLVGEPAPPADVLDNAGPLNFPNIEPGTYSLQITNVATQCSDIKTITVIDNPQPIVFTVADITSSPMQYCSDPASLVPVPVPGVYARIDVNSIGPGLLTDYTFNWFLNDPTSAPLVDGGAVTITDPFLDYSNYPTIAAGTYYVVAMRNPGFVPGSGCTSAPVEVIIEEQIVNPVLTLSATDNTACDNNFDATITASAVTTAGPGAGANYNWNWQVLVGEPAPPADVLDNAGPLNFPNIEPGTYSLQITNVATQCSDIKTITVIDNPQPIVFTVADITSSPMQYCSDPASLVPVPVPGVYARIDVNSIGPGLLTDYTFNWFFNDPTSAPLVDGGAVTITDPFLDYSNYPTIAAGTYYVVAMRNPGFVPGSGCTSAPVEVIIEEQIVNPVLTLSATDNTACDNNFDATITASAVTTAGPGAGANYNWNWQVLVGEPAPPADVLDNAGPLNFPNIEPGTYSLQITNVATQCSDIKTITVIDNPQPIVFTVADITSSPMQYCSDPASLVPVPVPGVYARIDVNSIGPGLLTDYTFNWFLNDPTSAPLVDGGAVTITDPFLDYSNYPTIAAGTYYVVAMRNPGFVPGSGCTSAPVEVIIEEQIVNPVLTLSATDNTACDNNWDATITVTTNTAGGPGNIANYNYTWISFPGASPGDLLDVSGALRNFTGIEPGTYVLQATNIATLCSSQATITVTDNPQPIVLTSTDIVVRDLAYCMDPATLVPVPTPAQYARIDINSIGPGNVVDYSFNWFFNDPTSAPLVDGGGVTITDSFLDYSNYPTIGVGTYYVIATRNATFVPGSGCTSAPVEIVIKDVSEDPVITFTQVSNTACDLLVANGQISATVTSSGNPVPLGSPFTWYVGPDVSFPPFVDGVDGNLDQTVVGQETIRNAQPGAYTLEVMDNSTGCSFTASFEIEDQPSIPNINLDNAIVVDQDICMLPSGSITIPDNAVSIGGMPASVADFDFVWTLNNPTSAPLTDGGGVPINSPVLSGANYPTMGAGTYFVAISAKAGVGAGCPGPPIKLVVKDISEPPQITFSTIVNSSCDVNMPNGSVIATVMEADGSTTDTYAFVWTFNGAALPVGVLQTDLNNTSTLTNAPDGNYSMTTTNVSATGCSFTQGVVLILDQSNSIPNIIDVDKTDPIDCNPSGTILVTLVNVGGLPQPVADFEYDWYRNDLDPSNRILDGGGVPINTPTISGLEAGTYFVIARALNTQCESIAKQIDIVEDNIVFPDVSINLDRPQTSCDNGNPNGQLTATADGGFDDTDPNYTFAWYSGSVVSGTPIATTSTLSGQGAGEYIVEVFNVTTGCSATQFYMIEDASEEFRLQVSATAVPVDLCFVDNGVLEARVINQTGTFDFQWTGPNGFSANGSSIANVPVGVYSVVATDPSLNYCMSLNETVVVRDNRMIPVVTIFEDNPLINCDVTNPNGQLTALGNDRVGGFDFDWYDGPSVSGPVTNTTNTYSGITVGIYTVEVTNQLSQCAATGSGEITDGTVTPPSPTALVLKNLTNCVVPDGEVTASVGGNVIDYLFNWFDGASSGNNPDNVGAGYDGLDLGDYTVTAVDIVTGCVSDPETVPIVDERVLPTFTYAVGPANCDDNNGYIELVFDDAFDVKDVVWSDAAGNEIDRNTNLYDREAGDYEVSVTTFLGCETTDATFIPTEITNYNGISANGDGENEGFVIDCITLFPNNNVKIFNRAGVLVYEADNYDNQDIIFTGTGLNGIYLAGENLPDGTYFYIIDKGDGSRPVTGYLELIR